MILLTKMWCEVKLGNIWNHIPKKGDIMISKLHALSNKKGRFQIDDISSLTISVEKGKKAKMEMILETSFLGEIEE